MIINEVTDTEISTEIRDRFLNPLGLNNTYFAVKEELPGSIAHPWDDLDEDGIADDLIDFDFTAYFSIEWTAGAMFSTAEDLTKWCCALFNGEFLTQATLDQMLTFYPLNPPGSALNGYGLGISSFKTEFTDGSTSFGHGGSTPGYRTIMVYLPEHDISITVLINEMNPNALFNILNDLTRVAIDYLN